MPKYTIYVQEVYDVWYEVEAENEEEVWDAYAELGLIESGREFSHVLDDSEEIVEKTDQEKPVTISPELAALLTKVRDEEDIL
jgi:hypothetical protein